MRDPDDPKLQNEVAERLMRYAAELRARAANDDATESDASDTPQTGEESESN